MTRASVRGLLVAGLLTAASTLSGCAMFSPVQTAQHAVVGDGVPVSLGPVVINNLLVVAKAKDGPGVVSGSVVNTSTQEVAIEFADHASGATTRVAVPAGKATQLSAQTQVQLDKVSAGPGALVSLTITTAQTGSAVVNVPVLDEQSYLATLTATAVPSETTSS